MKKKYLKNRLEILLKTLKMSFLRAKNIDSNTIIIEKDGEKIEVPFKYKYFKFLR